MIKRHLPTIILTILMLSGIALIAYPTVSDYWNSFHQTRAIMSYNENLASMDPDKYTDLLESAYNFNQDICKNGIQWTQTDAEKVLYNRQLDLNGTGNIGYISIDKISVRLPLYLGTEESVLQIGVGHIEGSSLPVGCKSWNSKEQAVEDRAEGAHCVLSGHRGLPSARLFTDLDKMVEGDTFTLNVLNETLTYQVDQIRVVEPTELSDLTIIKGQDYCTLVTCTPYGINTHRLLVRGHRVANAQGDISVVADAFQIEPIYIVPFLAVPVLLLLVLLLNIDSLRVRIHRRAWKASQSRLNTILTNQADS